MKQSKRLQQLPEHFFSTLVGKVAEQIEAGHDVILLGRGNPDQPTPPHIVEALKRAVDVPENHGYSPFRALPELKEAVAKFYKREYDVTLDPETEVAVLYGTKTGLVEIPFALLNEGETILLPDPGYPDYLSGVHLVNATLETMPLLEKNQFLPDYASLPERVKEAAKMMYLNYPSNPTAAVAPLSFFEETVEFSKARDIMVVHDFAYGGIGFDGKKPVSFLQADGAKDVGIETYSMSKTFNMAGWRVGFAVGNAQMIEAIHTLQDHLFIDIFPAIQHAAIEALGEDQSAVDELVAMYESRRNAFVQACQDIGWNVHAPEASFFAWLPVPAPHTSESFADLLLKEAHVAVAPGHGFGTYGEGFVRVGLLESEERLVEAVQRIAKLQLF
ncbi:pyridoxal phosphate-dependent aminotransferase [Savagea faecisuis]|uniref:Aminotransferase n=1 Tax=Savagea faecisuis TaxID=1274803 RepID=A0ABW3GVE0_9BACL